MWRHVTRSLLLDWDGGTAVGRLVGRMRPSKSSMFTALGTMGRLYTPKAPYPAIPAISPQGWARLGKAGQGRKLVRTPPCRLALPHLYAAHESRPVIRRNS